VPLRSFRQRHARASDTARGALVFAARGPRRKRVALLSGCIADTLLAGVSEAAVRVLTARGCDVEVLAAEGCCGALHIHNGAREEARRLARHNVRTFRPDDYDAIVSTAAGCSAELRHYHDLLPGDVDARAFSAKVRDISEVLAELESAAGAANAPRGAAAAPPPGCKVAYDEPCHLLHAQQISEPPKRLIESVPGVTRVPLEEADACCGGAGVYFLLQPELSKKVAARKVDAIIKSGAEVVATGNPGCLLQLRGALAERGVAVRVAHPIELLAEAEER
jgi:glycolate oxidase iron-sulfur subunit